MTYYLDDNLRSGNRAEDLAVVLLRQVGAVAQIPRTEDVGSDAIVTLLPRSGGNARKLGATQSCWIQIKTHSTEFLEFDHAQAHWLKELELPFFVARIDSKQTRIELFSLHLLWDLYACGASHSYPSGPPDSRMKLHFGEKREPHAWGYLGAPFVDWTFHEIEGAERRSRRDDVVAVLAAWCQLTQEARQLWSVGVNIMPTYESRRLPDRSSLAKRFGNDPAELCRIASESLSRIEALLMGMQARGDVVGPRDFISAIQRACGGVSPELDAKLIAMRESLDRFAAMY